MNARILGLLVLLLPSVAGADILEWRDADGVRHYTNLKGEVPKDQRESVQVVVDELARHPQAAEPAAPPAAAPPAATQPADEPRREAQVLYDRSNTVDAYVAGLERGLETAHAVSSGGSVQINAPLVAGGGSVIPSYGVLPPYHAPFITTGFDRGRSRFLTMRLLLDDQFTIDREGPFIVEGFPQCGRNLQGLALPPFLARGLPSTTVPRQARVVRR
jgi:hypothetical protein